MLVMPHLLRPHRLYHQAVEPYKTNPVVTAETMVSGRTAAKPGHENPADLRTEFRVSPLRLNEVDRSTTQWDASAVAIEYECTNSYSACIRTLVHACVKTQRWDGHLNRIVSQTSIEIYALLFLVTALCILRSRKMRHGFHPCRSSPSTRSRPRRLLSRIVAARGRSAGAGRMGP